MDDESTQLDVCDAEIFFLLRFRLLLHIGHVFSRAVTDTEHQSQITFCAAVTYYHETETEYSAFKCSYVRHKYLKTYSSDYVYVHILLINL